MKKAQAGKRLEAYGHQEKGAMPRQEDAHGFDVDTGCFVVADGLGQGLGGGDAARCATKLVVHLLRSWAHLDPRATLARAMDEAHQSCLREGKASGRPSQATLAALRLRNGRAFTAWAGDSRVYRLRLEEAEGNVTKWRPALLTRDHRDAVGTLLRNLGSQRGGNSAEADYHETDAQPGDVFALVTDGVWETLGDEQVARVLMESHVGAVATLSARWVAEALVHTALERGGTDNATALVVRVPRG